MKRFIPILLAAFLCTGCLKDSDSIAPLHIKISVPQDIDVSIDLTKVEVKMQNKTAPFTYITHPDADGNVSVAVQPGKYDILASAYYKSTRIAVNTSVSEFILTENGIVDAQGRIIPSELDMVLNVAIPNPLIIRELYYHGSSTPEGAFYTKDRYVEIYNNAGAGGAVQYLDSLCISTIFPYNSTTGNNAWEGCDTIPLAQMFWMFPGTGKSYPLEPGESCVVALLAAVDHSTRATSGLQLNKADFGCYADHLSGHEIAAGVTPMICYMAGQGNTWAVSIHSPAFIIFRPSMGVTEYRRQSSVWEQYEPGKTSGTKYWHIAKSWILDGVECVDKPEGAIKRLPSDIDASYTYMRSAHYSGKCVTRILDFIEDGVEVFKDTNNSDQDFTPDSPLNPRLKK